MKCALCLREAELRNSHILPEFLYSSLYDEIHRLQVLSVIPDKGNWREQKGLRERLLCDSCEQKLSVWEGYAKQLLTGGVEIKYRREGNMVFVSGFDYRLFRLFQLSVLWRAGVSSLQFFEEVQLGPHTELLRHLLLAGDTGSPEHYCCVMFGLRFNGGAFNGVITQPGKVRLNGQNAFRFVFGGFMWIMFASNQGVEKRLLSCTLQPPGTTAFLVREATDLENLERFSKELSRLGRAG